MGPGQKESFSAKCVAVLLWQETLSSLQAGAVMVHGRGGQEAALPASRWLLSWVLPASPLLLPHNAAALAAGMALPCLASRCLLLLLGFAFL